jgi:hypothetical protein
MIHLSICALSSRVNCTPSGACRLSSSVGHDHHDRLVIPGRLLCMHMTRGQNAKCSRLQALRLHSGDSRRLRSASFAAFVAALASEIILRSCPAVLPVASLGSYP